MRMTHTQRRGRHDGQCSGFPRLQQHLAGSARRQATVPPSGLRVDVVGFLTRLCAPWEREVLAASGLLRSRRAALLRRDRAFRHDRACTVRSGADRVLALPPLHAASADAADRDEARFAVLQDFFNEYNTVLSDHGIVVDVPSLDHPFYERRRQFISEAIPSLPGPRRRGGS